LPFFQMAEASMAAFGAAVGVLIAMAVVVFGLRGKGHSRAPDA
jgi:threonine/homoserine/homoserine lactone efflux protein